MGHHCLVACVYRVAWSHFLLMHCIKCPSWSKMNLNRMSQFHLHVLLLNLELWAFRSILSQHRVINVADSGKIKSNMSLNFGYSPKSLELKERITKKLNEMPEVFVHHDLDFRCTDKVKHHIKLWNVETNSDKVQALKTWPIPKNLKELRSLLGFSG